MLNPRQSHSDREAIQAFLKAKQKAKEWKRNLRICGGFGLLLTAIVTAVTLTVAGSDREKGSGVQQHHWYTVKYNG